MLADDFALVGDDLPFAAVCRLDRDHGGLPVDLGAVVPSAARERLSQIGGLDIAVLGVLDGAQNPLGFAERPDFLDLLWRQGFYLDPADRRGDARVIVVFIEPVARAREADVGDLTEADVEAGLLAEPLVQRDRILVDLTDRIGEVEQRQQSCRVPGRTRGQLLALQQDAVAPSLLRQ